MNSDDAERRAIAKRAHAEGASKAINKILKLFRSELELERRSEQEIPDRGTPSERREKLIQIAVDVMDGFEEREDGAWDSAEETIDDLTDQLGELTKSVEDFFDLCPSQAELAEVVKKTFLHGAKVGLIAYEETVQRTNTKTGDELIEAWNNALQSRIPTFDEMHQPKKIQK